MLRTRITALALAGLMTIAGTGITAFAAEPVETISTTSVNVMAETSNTGEKLETLLENGHTIVGLKNAKANLDAKGITMEEAKEIIAEKLAEFAEAHGLTVEEAKALLGAFKESGKTADELKNIKANLEAKGITLEDAKEIIAEKLAEFAEAHGLTVEEAKAKLEAFRESGKTADGLKNIKANLEAKGITLEDAKANFKTVLSTFASERGISFDEAKKEVSDMKNSGKTLKGLKNKKSSVRDIANQ